MFYPNKEYFPYAIVYFYTIIPSNTYNLFLKVFCGDWRQPMVHSQIPLRHQLQLWRPLCIWSTQNRPTGGSVQHNHFHAVSLFWVDKLCISFRAPKHCSRKLMVFGQKFKGLLPLL